jgi:hypothetical protein
MAPGDDTKALADNIAGQFAEEPPPPPPGEELEEDKGEGEVKKEDNLLSLDLTKNPEEIVGDLLKHPTLGRQLQSWAGKAAAKQVENAMRQANLDASQQAERQNLKDWDAHFQSLSEEELAEGLAKNKDARIAYGKVEEWKSQAGDEVRLAVAHVYAGQVQAILTTLESSGLPAAIKDTLNPQNFTHLGAQGIHEWQRAVEEAIIEFKAVALAETKATARKQQELAEQDTDHKSPDMTPARRGGDKPDLMANSNEYLLTHALTVQANNPGKK